MKCTAYSQLILAAYISHANKSCSSWLRTTYWDPHTQVVIAFVESCCVVKVGIWHFLSVLMSKMAKPC